MRRSQRGENEPLAPTTSFRVGEASKGPGPTPPETSGQVPLFTERTPDVSGNPVSGAGETTTSPNSGAPDSNIAQAGALAQGVRGSGRSRQPKTAFFNPRTAGVRCAYRQGGGNEMRSFEGAVARPEHVRTMLKGLDEMAQSQKLPPAARLAAVRLAAELRKASANGLRPVAIPQR
jgi:hypothetical protein